ncbi:MAG: riboflavin biosynthesis protein RibF, partial [Paludibacteraceae bacterium]|nr:riboflavin biosynthesis protein RibF [Paludibacteraceae bacterium]
MRYIATIGFFDGVHLGHQYLLSQLKEEAAKRG